MDTDMNTIRLLGAAQLIVFLSAIPSELMFKSVVGSGSISDIFVNISKKRHPPTDQQPGCSG